MQKNTHLRFGDYFLNTVIFHFWEDLWGFDLVIYSDSNVCLKLLDSFRAVWDRYGLILARCGWVHQFAGAMFF